MVSFYFDLNRSDFFSSLVQFHIQVYAYHNAGELTLNNQSVLKLNVL